MFLRLLGCTTRHGRLKGYVSNFSTTKKIVLPQANLELLELENKSTIAFTRDGDRYSDLVFVALHGGPGSHNGMGKYKCIYPLNPIVKFPCDIDMLWHSSPIGYYVLTPTLTPHRFQVFVLLCDETHSLWVYSIRSTWYILCIHSPQGSRLLPLANENAFPLGYGKSDRVMTASSKYFADRIM
jgi:hypothetical protein